MEIVYILLINTIRCFNLIGKRKKLPKFIHKKLQVKHIGKKIKKKKKLKNLA